MHPINVLKKWPSVSTAAAMLLGLQRAEASLTEESVTSDLKHDCPIKPLLLSPSKIKLIPGHLFAGHRSHSSHSSHSSGSSGGHASHASHASGTSSGAYAPAVPSYIAPIPAPPSYSAVPKYSNSIVAPRPTPKPMLSPSPTIRIELTNGAVIYGTLLAKSAGGITFKGIDQKGYKIPRLILAPSTIASLGLPPEQ